MLNANELNQLKEGDVVFIATANALYRRVARDTNSLASHVGILFADGNGGWEVAESTFPVAKYTPLNEFLDRSDNGWFCIRRLKDEIKAEQIVALRAQCDQRMGIPYHAGFNYESRKLFCSKLVYEVFRDVLGIEVGELETFRELLSKKQDPSLFFWRLWFFGFIPWQRLTVTPASQMISKRLLTVSENDQVSDLA